MASRAVSRDGIDAGPARAPTRSTYSPGTSGCDGVTATRNVRPPCGTLIVPVPTATSAVVVSVTVASKPSLQDAPTIATPPISPTTQIAADAVSPGFQPTAICSRSGRSRE